MVLALHGCLGCLHWMRVRYRWLRARDLNLHLDFQVWMITADSLLRYQNMTTKSGHMILATSRIRDIRRKPDSSPMTKDSPGPKVCKWFVPKPLMATMTPEEASA